jgi:uncharacterized protein (DUF2225 family)
MFTMNSFVFMSSLLQNTLGSVEEKEYWYAKLLQRLGEVVRFKAFD